MCVWLKQFSSTDKEKLNCIPIDGYIRQFEFQQAFKDIHKKTSSSPSGIHYTFWKCMALDDDIANYMTVMMCLPFMHGFANNRWAKCLDVMLEKKSGVRQIHQLESLALWK